VARNKKEIKMIMTSREEGEQNDKENKHWYEQETRSYGKN
jgi:hypothetical protein